MFNERSNSNTHRYAPCGERSHQGGSRFTSPGVQPARSEPRPSVAPGPGQRAAVRDDSSPIDRDLLDQVIEVSPTLPPAIPEAILAMLRAAG